MSSAPPSAMAALAIEQGRARATPTIDSNGDGVITREAYLAAPAPGFARIDQNADGILSADELAAVEDRPARRLRRTP